MPTIRFYCVLCGTALRAAPDCQESLMECPTCLRNVPVPRLANVLGPSKACPLVFPPEVLELSVKFHCTSCHARLRTDARWEGRRIVCPTCGRGTGVPRWSTIPIWPNPSDPLHETSPREEAALRGPRPPVTPAGTTLSPEEVDFLSQAQTQDPEAAA